MTCKVQIDIDVKVKDNSDHSEDIFGTAQNPKFVPMAVDKRDKQDKVEKAIQFSNDESDIKRQPESVQPPLAEDQDHGPDDSGGEDGDHDGKVGCLSQNSGATEPTTGTASPTSPQLAGAPGNIYQRRKFVAQGMIDLALLFANASQLRYVIESSTMSYYILSIVLISLSIVIQIVVGVLLIMSYHLDEVAEREEAEKKTGGTKDVESGDAAKKSHKTRDRMQYATLLGIFAVIVINVFITTFSGKMGESSPGV